MKKQIATLCTVLTLVACVDYNDNTESVKTVGIQLLKPDGFTDNSGLGGRTITLIADNGKRLTATTDANGLAKVNDLTPNIYNISASWEISGSEYVRLTDGQMPVLSDAHNFTLTGSLANQLLTKEETVSVQMLANENPDIIISKIYFAASRDENNKNYEAGRYIELFNQSDEPVDVSGLYIGLTESEGTQAYTLANLHEQHNDSVLLLKQIFRIPADEPHLVEPSGTVLIVNSAIDHTKNKAPLEADLTGADFEAKDNSTTRPLTNNPDVKALELIYSTYATISNMNLVNNGLCGVVIFRQAVRAGRGGVSAQQERDGSRHQRKAHLPGNRCRLHLHQCRQRALGRSGLPQDIGQHGQERAKDAGGHQQLAQRLQGVDHHQATRI